MGWPVANEGSRDEVAAVKDRRRRPRHLRAAPHVRGQEIRQDEEQAAERWARLLVPDLLDRQDLFGLPFEQTSWSSRQSSDPLSK